MQSIPVRAVDEHQARRYRQLGLWTNETLASHLLTRLSATPETKIVVHSASRPCVKTYGLLSQRAVTFATWLAAAGVAPGSSIILQAPNWFESLVVLLGGFVAGCVAVPVPMNSGRYELDLILSTVDAGVYVGAGKQSLADKFDRLEFARQHPSAPSLVCSLDRDASVGFVDLCDVLDSPHAAPTPQLRVAPTQPALIAFTSGSAARPKAVVHTNASALAEVIQLARVQPDEDPAIVGAPIAHAIGLLSGFFLPIELGREIHLIDVWMPARVLELMIDEQLTAGSGSPFFATSLLDDPHFTDAHKSRMRFVGLGGAPIPDDLEDRLEANGASVARLYGSTEHPSVLGSRHDQPRDVVRYTEGMELDGVEVKLIGDHRKEQGDTGELLTRGPDLFAGYLDPDLTRETLDADGWYRTGDVARRFGNGTYKIVGRTSEIIFRGGSNVSPEEVELILQSAPGVAEAVVTGVPDSALGMRVIAGVLIESSGQVNPRELRGYLRTRGLAAWKIPEQIVVLEEIGRLPNGKIDRKRMSRRIALSVQRFREQHADYGNSID